VVTVCGVVDFYELVEVVAAQGLLFEGEVGIGARVVDPELARPRVLASRLFVEEEDVCLYSLA
jgi:hypothetical protein